MAATEVDPKNWQGAFVVGDRPFMPFNSWTFNWHGFEPRAVRAGEVVNAHFAIS